MSPFTIVAKREFLSRVRKRSFLLMTILGPIFFGGLIVAPALLQDYVDTPEQNLLVVDNSYLLSKGPPNSPFRTKQIGTCKLAYLPNELSLSEAEDSLRKNEQMDGLLYLPASKASNPDVVLRSGKLIAKNSLPVQIKGELETALALAATNEKLKERGVDPDIVKQAQSRAVLESNELTEAGSRQSDVGIKLAIGFGASFLVYIFIFLYAAQIMRGVIEEKTSRIVEVIVSSIKPSQLMLGKILGIAAVGLLQFLIWVFLTLTIVLVANGLGLVSPDPAEVMANPSLTASPVYMEVSQSLQSLNISLLISTFAFYFIGGYLLYGSLFAAVGSAVDSETDTQQFMLPLTIPLVLTFVLATSILNNPNGSLAFWLSVIPFSAPIGMMIRIPFGVPIWEVGLSMGLLVVAFLTTTWIAGRIYRIGILSYGQKVTYATLWKWLFMKP